MSEGEGQVKRKPTACQMWDIGHGHTKACYPSGPPPAPAEPDLEAALTFLEQAGETTAQKYDCVTYKDGAAMAPSRFGPWIHYEDYAASLATLRVVVGILASEHRAEFHQECGVCGLIAAARKGEVIG